MSFVKRHINEEGLLDSYSRSGIDGVAKYLKADAIFSTDALCRFAIKNIYSNPKELESEILKRLHEVNSSSRD
jgi:hypothetical protein